PNRRRYSRLNWEALSYPTRNAALLADRPSPSSTGALRSGAAASETAAATGTSPGGNSCERTTGSCRPVPPDAPPAAAGQTRGAARPPRAQLGGYGCRASPGAGLPRHAALPTASSATRAPAACAAPARLPGGPAGA